MGCACVGKDAFSSHLTRKNKGCSSYFTELSLQVHFLPVNITTEFTFRLLEQLLEFQLPRANLV